MRIITKPQVSVRFYLVNLALAAAAGTSLAAEDWKTAATLVGHESVVKSLAFSPDGKLLASGGKERMVTLWTAGS